jgi:O-antigen/teichoic acid export membrane protein
MPANRWVLPDAFLWMFLSGTLVAASTFIMLVVVIRTAGLYWGGVFSLALAVALQLQTIGCFSVRPFQVADSREHFAFGDYLAARLATILLMLLAGCGWLVCRGLSRDKAATILLLIGLKLAESLANVLEGRYHQKDRLDVACRSLFWKTLLPLLLFCALMLGGSPLIPALAALVALHALLLLLIDGRLIQEFGGWQIRWNTRRIGALLRACLPLFINAYLLMVINQAAKFALNRQADEATLTRYSALFMVAYLPPLLSNFAMSPLMTRLARAWPARDPRPFYRLIGAQLVWIAGLTTVGLALIALGGETLLSRLFGTDLSPYRRELMLLLAGGSLIAASLVFQYVLVILRRLAIGLLCMTAATLIASLITRPLVAQQAIAGAAWSFAAVSAGMCALFMLATWYAFRRATEPNHPARP